MNRLGIIGCGFTAAVTSKLLKEKFPSLKIVILEKSRGTGGRMCTSRNSKGSSVDLGTQFITRTAQLSNVQERCYTELLEAGLLEPLSEVIDGLKFNSTVDNFICPKGSGSLVKHFLFQSGSEILFQHKAIKINLLNNRWLIECDNGSSYEFDAVVLTIPVPQILDLEGMYDHIKEHVGNLNAIEYCSRFALGLFYKENTDLFTFLQCGAKFISDNPIIRFYSLQRWAKNSDGSPSIVIHTTKEFGKFYLNQKPEIVQNLIITEFKKQFPQIPDPTEIKFHKWRYSQVMKNSPAGCLPIVRNPTLICGGDGFTSSTFEGCIHSAENIVLNITN